MAQGQLEWKYHIGKETETRHLDRTPVFEHPLKNVFVVERIPRKILGSQPSTGRTTPISTPLSLVDPLAQALKQLDPLSEFAMQEIDPLSKMAAEMDKPVTKVSAITSSKDATGNHFSDMESWEKRKATILSKYTTSEKISIITSFLYEGEKVMVKAQSTAVDKVQHRLDQIDSFEEGPQRKLNLSQSEYITRIDQLNKELVTAWNGEQRVKSLKIAIQCAKLLADTDVLPFYPSKFVLVTDILDTFGKLVYERLKSKSEYTKPGPKTATPLPDNFTPDMIPDTAKETCLNWFYKVASIRELIPRLYVEMALLKSYNFISTTDCSEGLQRIVDMIYGVGNPLVAAYARCYLSRVGITVSDRKANFDFLYANYKGFLHTYQHLYSRCVISELNSQKITLSSYLSLYTPALDFMLEAVACTVNESVITDLLNICKLYENSSLILNTLMSAFKPAYIAERTLEILDVIVQCSDEGMPLYLLLRTLGLCLNVSPPPYEHKRQILNTVWKYISSLSNPSEYIAAVEAWILYVVSNFSNRDVNLILGDIILHMKPNRHYENFYNELKMIVNKVVSHTQDFEMLLVMDNFLPLVDLFQQESIKVEVCKNILISSNSLPSTNDPVITNALTFLCSTLHDSVNALTPEDEYKQIGEIICNVIRKVNYGKDFEQQLNFYVEARGAFSNIDIVLAELVQHVNTLSVNTRQAVKGMHTRKTGDFVRACAAYCFITIPSIISEKARLELYLLSGRVALFNQCFGQADACFKAALMMLPGLDDSEVFLASYLKEFLSTLLTVPDNPERGVLSLLRMLLNVIRGLDWNKQNCNLAVLYINVIDLLSNMSEEDYLYHVDRVESNDALYGSDPKFLSEINNICAIIIEEILTLLKDLGSCRRQSQLATELFLRIALRGDLTVKSVIVLAHNLWQLSLKYGHADLKYMAKTKEYLGKHAITTKNKSLQKLVDKLTV